MMNRTSKKIILIIISIQFMLHTYAYSDFISVDIQTFSCGIRIETTLSEINIVNTKPDKDIEIIGNDVSISANITNNFSFTAAAYYSINDGVWESHSMTLTNAQDKTYSYTIPASKITTNGTLQYYIKVTDTNNSNKSSSAVTVNIKQTKEETIPESGGTITMNDGNPNDGQTTITIPAGALFGNTKITMEQKNPADYTSGGTGNIISQNPFTVFEFGPNMYFNKPLTITLLYFDLNDDGKVDASDINEGLLKAFYWDGFEWRLMGGTLDTVNNTITFKSTHFSVYAVFPANITKDSYRPKERIITPAYVDNKNDYAQFDGLSDNVTEIKIYDVQGTLVRTLSDIPYQWDGRDENGAVVESGVYIYQFLADINGKTELISGTIAIAK
ncbi:MAG: gliding motility-associated C-terminal domain-containing protein [Elusimicrobiota bacterium]